MSEILDQEIKYLKGVGPKRAELLARELNILTCRDLLYFFPYKYIDRSKFYAIKEIDTAQAFIQVKGKINAFRLEGQRHKQRLVAIFSDGTGTLELVWFKGLQWITSNYQLNTEYIAFGRPAIYNNRLSIAHPELEPAGKDAVLSPLQPQYSNTEKLKSNFITSKTIHKMVSQVLMPSAQFIETLPDYLVKKFRMMDLGESIRQMHFPEDNDKLRKAIYRLKFEELFYLQLNILAQKGRKMAVTQGLVFSNTSCPLNLPKLRNVLFGKFEKTWVRGNK